MKIKDWCADERPREKMLAKGARALGNAELLAILLRTGMKGMNVMEVAQKLLSSVGGSLTEASGLTVEELCRIEGIGPGKAVSVVAALELGKRLCAEAPESDPKIIYSAADVYREMLPVMRGLHHEECWLFFLARNSRIILRERLSSGGQCETVVDIKTVVRRAIDTRACGVIITHNHPSGDPRPGEADKTLTMGLMEALETFDIKLVDHIIIADGLYYSFVSDTVSSPDSNARPKRCPVRRTKLRMVSEKESD